jgi:hypothetical protein
MFTVKEIKKALKIKGYTDYEINHTINLIEEMKTLKNTTASKAKENVKDISFWGNPDTFKLISKAYSIEEKWMKSTKAMEIENVGCVVQVTTQQGDNIAEAITFVPKVKIKETKDEEGNVIGRELTAMI